MSNDEIALKYARLAAGTMTVFPWPMQMHKDGGIYHADLYRLFQQAIEESKKEPQ